MENREFLQVLYGKVNQGALSVSWRVNGKLSTKWYDASQLDEMSEFIVKTGKNHDTSINLNPRSTPLSYKQRGTRYKREHQKTHGLHHGPCYNLLFFVG